MTVSELVSNLLRLERDGLGDLKVYFSDEYGNGGSVNYTSIDEEYEKCVKLTEYKI